MLICLALLPGRGDDNSLESSLEGTNGPRYEFISNYEGRAGAGASHVITSTVRSYQPNATFLYQLESGEKGSVRMARVVGGKVEPRSVTLVRTTYRPVVQAMHAVRGSAAPVPDDFQIGGVCWAEARKAVPAQPGASQEAKLIAGDVNGKVRVRLACAVAGDGKKGYAYTYTIENGDSKEVTVRWAGFSATLKPKETFTKSVPTAKLTDERAEMAVIDFGDGEATVHLKTNVWLKR
jgi:hypothetical protein